MAGHWEPKLVIDDVQFDEATSAMQKCIRRGLEYEANYWAFLLYKSNYGAYLWRRLSSISSEDIGGGDDFSAVLVSSLRSSWQEAHKQLKENTLDHFLFFSQAILHLCRAKKSRENDSLSNLLEENWKLSKRLPVPEVAKDSHTLVGKQKFGKFGANDGKEIKRIDLWFSEWSKITNESYPDKWQSTLEKIWRDKANAMKNTP